MIISTDLKELRSLGAIYEEAGFGEAEVCELIKSVYILNLYPHE